MMQSGNGIDLAAIHHLLTEVAQTVRGQGERLDRIETHLGAQDQVLNQLVAVVNEHTRKLDQLVTIVNEHSRKIDDLAAGLNELRLAVNQYHDAAIGHGIEMTRLGERVTRIEAHLNLDTTAS
jgi:ABC-type transporter Mla subunit MlaD